MHVWKRVRLGPSALSILIGAWVLFHCLPWGVEASTNLPPWMTSSDDQAVLTAAGIAQYLVAGSVLLGSGLWMLLRSVALGQTGGAGNGLLAYGRDPDASGSDTPPGGRPGPA